MIDYEEVRSERRSFYCSNKMWKELKNVTKDCIPISRYINMAIVEKMIKDEPAKKDYYISLIE